MLTPLVLADPPSAVRRPTRPPRCSCSGRVHGRGSLIYSGLIAEIGPGGPVITYVAPVVAVALGVAVLGERPGAGAVAGLPLIIAGVAVDRRAPAPGADRHAGTARLAAAAADRAGAGGRASAQQLRTTTTIATTSTIPTAAGTIGR